MATGFVYDERFLSHEPGPGHPERKARLVAALRHLEAQPWFAGLTRIAPERASEDAIRAVHTVDYIRRAEAACRSGAAHLDVPDVGISPDSYDCAVLAAGGATTLADAVVAGEIDNAFSLSRPPGHHAEASLALGFCLFNNVAIAARHLQRRHGIDKVLILDWDVHHGNGTQHTFEADPSVLFVSLHQYPFYPGTGAASETGQGPGAGATVNCPMPAGSGDADYERAFGERVLPAIDAFGPEFVLVSAGFDAHAADPLGGLSLSTECFTWMTERVLEVADRHAGGRLVALLEGGYDLEALSACVATHVERLAAA